MLFAGPGEYQPCEMFSTGHFELMIITIFGILGAIIGANISIHVDVKILKKYFGIFLAIIAINEIYSITKKYKKSKKKE